MTSEAQQAAQSVIQGIKSKGGEFIANGDDISILLGGKLISIGPDFKNYAYATLQIEACGLGTMEYKGRNVCQRVLVLAGQEAVKTRVESFSAISKDKRRIYIPIQDGALLQIEAEGLMAVPNGQNCDSVWVTHPQNAPFAFLPEASVRQGLQDFEKLCVNTQACANEDQKWLVAMQEGLFPYVRDFAIARMIIEHLGPSQHGKTSGAQRFTKLHGLGEVLGDVSPAYLRNSCGSMGLLALDNKEQASYGQDLIDFLLFCATGGRHGRSTQAGAAREMRHRPVIVLTSIEGVYKHELEKRLIPIPYSKLEKQYSDRDRIEEQIESKRDEILTAICRVIQRFLAISSEEVESRFSRIAANNPFPEFAGYFRVLARLMFAYAVESERPAEWADAIILGWMTSLTSREREEDVLETHVEQTLQLYEAVRSKDSLGSRSPATVALLDSFRRIDPYFHSGQAGVLYITTAGELLTAMRNNRIGLPDLPNTSQAFGRRLDSGTWTRLRVLKEEDDPAVLRRTANRRSRGIFRPSDKTNSEEDLVVPGWSVCRGHDECDVSQAE